MATMLSADPTTTTFEQQCDRLIELGYPALAGLTTTQFRARLEPLRAVAAGLPDAGGEIPFVIVVDPVQVNPSTALAQVSLRGKSAFTTMTDADLAAFAPTEHVTVPGGNYLLIAPRTGTDTLNLPPQSALSGILSAGRSPLTIAEGPALITQFPQLLRSANCFSMLGSRCDDRRVTALWVSKGRPRLGWCWDGAPHTWLGSASCAGRMAA